MPTKTKQTTKPAGPPTKGGSAAELFERGHKVIHGTKPPGSTTKSPSAVSNSGYSEGPQPSRSFHPISASVGTPGLPPSYFEPAEMTRTHELIVDAVTAMLAKGGHRDDVDGLLRATMAHTRRRTYDSFDADERESSDAAAKFIQTHYEDWRQDLATVWRKNKRNPVPAVEPKSITDRIRLNVREALAGMFEEFLGISSPEEQRFFLNVFHRFSGRNHPAENGDAELYLATAFENELGRDRCHILVPERMLDQAEAYVKALRAVEDKAVA